MKITKLELISVLGVSLCFFPLIVFSQAVFNQIDFAVVWLNMLLNIVLSFSSFFLSKVLKNVKFAVPFVKFLIAVLLAVGLSLYVNNLYMYFVFILSSYMGMFSDKECLSGSKIGFYTATTLISWAVLSYMNLQIDVVMTSIVFLYVAFFYFIYVSQKNINSLMERRGHSLAMLPKTVRKYSLTAVCLCFSLVITGFGFTGALSSIFSLIRDGIRFVLQALLDGNYVQQPSSTPTPTTEPTPTPEKEDYFEFVEATQMSMILQIIIWGAFIFGIVYIIVVNASTISNMFKKQKTQIKQVSDLGAYTDTVEVLLEKNKKDENYSIKHWKKEYKFFKTENNNDKKLEKGYLLVLKWLKLNEVPIDNSMTPNEIFSTTKDFIKSDNWSQTNIDFNNFKYADKNSEIDKVTKLLDDLNKSKGLGSQIKKRRRKS